MSIILSSILIFRNLRLLGNVEDHPQSHYSICHCRVPKEEWAGSIFGFVFLLPLYYDVVTSRPIGVEYGLDPKPG